MKTRPSTALTEAASKRAVGYMTFNDCVMLAANSAEQVLAHLAPGFEDLPQAPAEIKYRLLKETIKELESRLFP